MCARCKTKDEFLKSKTRKARVRTETEDEEKLSLTVGASAPSGWVRRSAIKVLVWFGSLPLNAPGQPARLPDNTTSNSF